MTERRTHSRRGLNVQRARVKVCGLPPCIPRQNAQLAQDAVTAGKVVVRVRMDARSGSNPVYTAFPAIPGGQISLHFHGFRVWHTGLGPSWTSI